MIHGNSTSSLKTHKNKLLKNKIDEKINFYHFLVSSGCLQLLREEHVTRLLKRNIVDRIHFDLSETQLVDFATTHVNG